jgi:cytochrome c556
MTAAATATNDSLWRRYAHFKTKEAVFEAVFDLVSRDLVTEIDGAARAEKDVLVRDGRRHPA